MPARTCSGAGERPRFGRQILWVFDVLVHVRQTISGNGANDESREMYQRTRVVEEMVQARLAATSREGLYKKVEGEGDKGHLDARWDTTIDYSREEGPEGEIASLEMVKALRHTGAIARDGRAPCWMEGRQW